MGAHQRKAAEALARFRAGSGAGRAAAPVAAGRDQPRPPSGMGAASVASPPADAPASRPDQGAPAPVARPPARRPAATPKSRFRAPQRPCAGVLLPEVLRGVEALSREQLIRRWTWGSDATFRRLETDGLLVPRLFGTEPKFFWEDVFLYEGGLPPEGMEEAYREDLVTPEVVARVRGVQPDTIYDYVGKDLLPARRVGRFKRFVPVEVVRWMKSASVRSRGPGGARDVRPARPQGAAPACAEDHARSGGPAMCRTAKPPFPSRNPPRE